MVDRGRISVVVVLLLFNSKPQQICKNTKPARKIEIQGLHFNVHLCKKFVEIAGIETFFSSSSKNVLKCFLSHVYMIRLKSLNYETL